MNQESPKFNKEPQPELSEKELKWQKTELEVEKIVDSLGHKIDKNIKETVVALKVYGFPTRASCEGHLDWGEPFPWVGIRTPEPEGWKESEEKKEKWRKENLKQQKRMMELLDEFYKNKEVPFDARLTLRNIGGFGGFCIQSLGAEVIAILPPEEQKDKLELYHKQMNEFTSFLRNKYFSE